MFLILFESLCNFLFLDNLISFNHHDNVARILVKGCQQVAVALGLASDVLLDQLPGD